MADLCQALTEGDEVYAFVQKDVRHLPGHLEIRHSLNEPNRSDVLAIKLVMPEIVRNAIASYVRSSKIRAVTQIPSGIFTCGRLSS